MRIGKKAKQAGFSLVELMVVVAIIGVLAALAIPRFQSFQAKARQSEVKSNLSHVYTLEQSYFGDNDTYVDFGAIGVTGCGSKNVIGFNPQPCGKVRYDYLATGSSATAFTAYGNATATRIVPGCNTSSVKDDSWAIDQNKDLKVKYDAVAECN